MKKLPQEITIMGLKWRIEASKLASDSSQTFGSTICRTQTITIDPEAPFQYQQKTLLHEILHACWWQTGLTKDENIKQENEEKIIHALSSALFQVLKENTIKFS